MLLVLFRSIIVGYAIMSLVNNVVSHSLTFLAIQTTETTFTSTVVSVLHVRTSATILTWRAATFVGI